jgi:hypothetical protein
MDTKLFQKMLQQALRGSRLVAYLEGDGPMSDTRVTDAGEVYLTVRDAKQFEEEGLIKFVSDGGVGWVLTAKGRHEAPQYVEIKNLDLKSLFKFVFALPYFLPDNEGEAAIPYVYHEGGSKSKLVLVLGENAGGKSFFRRLIQAATDKGHKNLSGHYSGRERKPGPFPVSEMIHISMQGRTQGGVVSAFVYGSEDWQSTGQNSAYTVAQGIKTVNERSHRVIVYWDEPDIGMSAGSAAGAGATLQTFVQSPSPFVQGVFVTSHSPALIKALTRDLKGESRPHYVYLGSNVAMGAPATLAAWFKYQVNPHPVTPEALQEEAHKRFKKIQKILNRKENK